MANDFVGNSGLPAQLQSFIEAAPCAMLLVGEGGRIALVNSQAEQVFQYTREEMLGQAVELLVPERFRQDHRQDRQHYFADPQSRTMGKGRELRALRKDGHEFDVEIGLNVFHTDTETFILTSVVDITERKHAEDLFHQLFQHSPDGTVVADHTGHIVLVNTQAEEMFGYTSEELVGQPIEILVPMNMRRKHSSDVKSYYERPCLRPMGMQGRFFARRKDGTEFPVEISLAPIQTGRGLMVFASVRDVTEHRRLLREIEGNFQVQRATAEILRLSLTPLSLVSLLGHSLELLLAVPWLGRDPAGSVFLVEDDPEVLVMQAQRGLPPELAERCRRVPVGECLCGVTASRREIVFTADVTECHTRRSPEISSHGHYCVPLRTDGRMLGVLSIYVAPDHQRRPEEESFLSAMADLLAGLVERKRAESALEQSEERFELAVAGTDAGVWDWDLRTNQVYFSPRWKSIIGYAPDEISQDFAEWETRLHPDDRERALAAIRDYVDGRSRQYDLEHRLRHKDGSYRWILARGAVVCDDAGKPYRMAGSHLDITDRKTMEEKLRVHLAQLIAAEEMQSHLLPEKSPEIPGFEIAGQCYPAEFAAGDHFDFLTLKDGTFVAVIGDVSGHGVGPAILMAFLHAHLRSLAEVHTDLCAVINRANNLLEQESPDQHFVTLLAVAFDSEARTMTYVRCGHPPGFIMSAEGEIAGWMTDGSLPLGILPDTQFPQSAPIQLSSGDVVVVLTDGILEAFSPERMQFGIDRTVQLVREHRKEPAAQIIEALRDAVRGYTRCAELSDDLTLVVTKVE